MERETNRNIAGVIERELLNLVGLRLVLASYAGNMREFAFGELRDRVGVDIGEYALHISCPWRINNAAQVITGCHDWYLRDDAGQDSTEDDAWDPDKGGNLQQVRLRQLFNDHDNPLGPLVNRTDVLQVLRVQGDDLGGCDIFLTPDYRLSIFPTCSRDEYWRFFRPGVDRHLVIEAGHAAVE